MWIILLAVVVVVASLMILNARVRSRLERLGGKSEDPTRRYSWMRWGS